MTSNKFTIAAQADKEIVVTRVFQAPRQWVFNAFTKPEQVKAWMAPGAWQLATCESDPRPGGAMRFVWRGPDGADMGLTGCFQEVKYPGRLVHTEIFDDDWTGGETTVTTTFRESGGRTNMTLTIRYPNRHARDTVLQSPMGRGMAACYDKLDALLATAPAQAS